MTVAEAEIIELTPEVREALSAYPGKWVALNPAPVAILAVEDTPAEAFQAAQRAGVETPLLYQVPDSTLRAYYY
jgi:hypothetical protein